MVRLLLLLLLLIPNLAMAEPGRLCRAAIQAAEREFRLPAHLLTAIARIESGRRDPETGAFHPWPWTINAEGAGSFFPTKEAAIAEARALQARGVRSIDIGCMQVNLRHHPDAFASLEEAFDPQANARYAARFLSELAGPEQDWQRAAGAYHSQTPGLAEPYRARVLAAWAEERRSPVAVIPTPASPSPPRFAAAPGGGGFSLSNGSQRAATLPTAPGMVGRGLDAYRGMPVPITGRAPQRLAVLAR